MNEDGPRNIAPRRRLALDLARAEGIRDSTKDRIECPGWDDGFLLDMVHAAAKRE